MDIHTQMLDKAERMFSAGQYSEGADLVRQAAFNAVKTAAAKAGKPVQTKQDILSFAATLPPPSERPDLEMWHYRNLAIADSYPERAAAFGNSNDWQWQPHDFSHHLASIRDMVNHLRQTDMLYPSHSTYSGDDPDLRLLNQALSLFTTEQYVAGADLVWEAAYNAVASAAGRAGQPCRDKMDAFRFAKTLPPPAHLPELEHWHRINLSAADAYVKQANKVEPYCYWPWQPHEYVEHIASIRDMVRHLNSNPTPWINTNQKQTAISA